MEKSLQKAEVQMLGALRISNKRLTNKFDDAMHKIIYIEQPRIDI